MTVALPFQQAEISELVDHFYAKVRKDEEIGPIFNETVESWDAHLALLKDFWTTVLTGEPKYKGNPMLAHFPLKLEQKHFHRWLSLFEETAAEIMSPEHTKIILRKAEQIAANIERMRALYGAPTPA